MDDSEENEISITTPDIPTPNIDKMREKWEADGEFDIPLFDLEHLHKQLGQQTTLSSITPKINKVAESEPVNLTRQQQLNIAKITWILDQKNQAYTPDAIFAYWPTHPSMLERAGERPTLLQIQRWMTKPKYEKDLNRLGMQKDQDSGHLTAEQIMCIQYLTDTSSTKGFQVRLRELGIKPVKYRSWMRQKEFNDAIKRIAGSALTDSIPMAETALAAQAAAGDLKAIKFAFEVTGRHDPARQQQVDTQALIGVIIDTVQEVFGSNPDKLREFASLVSIRAKGVRGVIQQ